MDAAITLLKGTLAPSLILAGLLSHLEPILVVTGVVVFALATFRTRSTELVRKENHDLRERNATLEAKLATETKENHAHVSKIAALEAQPDFSALATMLSDLSRIVSGLLEREASRTETIEHVVGRLDEIAKAVIPPVRLAD